MAPISRWERWPLPARSLRGILLFLLALVLVPVLVVQVILYTSWYTTRVSDESQNNLEFAWDIAQGVDASMADILHQELAIGMGLEGMEGDKACAYLRANAIAFPSVRAFLWVNPDGAVTSCSQSQGVGVNVADRDYVQAFTGQQRDWFVGDLTASRVDGKKVFFVSRPIRDAQGRLQGIVAASVDPNLLGQSVLDARHDRPGTIALFDHTGTLAYYEGEGGSRSQDLLQRDPLLRQAVGGKEASGKIMHPITGQWSLVARVPIGRTGWVAGSARPEIEAIRPILVSLAVSLAILLGVVALSAMLALGLHARVLSALALLKEQAVSLGKGQLKPPPCRLRIEEFHTLSEELSSAGAELQQAQQALLRSENRLRLALESAELGTWDYDPRTGQLEWSDRCKAIFALPAGAPVNYPTFLDRLHPADRERTDKAVQSALDPAGCSNADPSHPGVPGQSDFLAEYRVLWPDGTSRWVDARGRAFFADVDGQRMAVRFLGTVMDITQRRTAQDTLQQTVDDLARSNRDLEQFAYVSSHDLQEPLRMVVGYLQLLERRYKEKLDKDADEFIRFAVEGGQRMQNLINDLLAYSRVGTRGRSFGAVDIQRSVQRALAGLRTQLDTTGAVVRTANLSGIEVLGDEEQLATLFQNLIANAVKFHQEGRPPEIEIGGQKVDGAWRLWVKDNGIGIEPQYKERIFLIFQRLHTRDKYPGTGMGLSICKRIVERHGGIIWVESEPGTGSTFFFTLPQRGEQRG